MTAFFRCNAAWVGLRVRSFAITPESDLYYLSGHCGFLLGSFPGFCRLKITGRWSLPWDGSVSARVHDACLGDTSAKSITLSVLPCRAPRCVGVAALSGVKRASLSASSAAHPCWFYPVNPTNSTVHWNHRISRHSQFVFHLLKEVSTCPCSTGGRVHVFIDDSRGFVPLVWVFFYSEWPAIRTTHPIWRRILSY